MIGKRINIPAILMVLAILAIIAFQAYWMYKNYQEEEKTLQIRTTAMFRNVAYRLQAENLKSDTTLRAWAAPRSTLGAPAMLIDGTNSSVVQERVQKASVRQGYVPPGKHDSVRALHKPGKRIIVTTIATKGDSTFDIRKTIPLDSFKTDRIRSVSVLRSLPAVPAYGATDADSNFTITVNDANTVGFQPVTGGRLKGEINSIRMDARQPEEVVTGLAARPRPARVSLRTNGKDSIQEFMVLSRLMEDGSFQNLFQRVDSLNDTVSLTELSRRFRDALDKESMKLKFSLEKDSISLFPPEMTVDPTRINEVVMGYSKPYFIRYELQNTLQYITRKLSSQIGLSLLLIALTSFTFVLLYRNMMKQRRLTQFKNDLISNITHELKTPIATVSVAIEALRNFHAMDDPRRTEEYLDISNSELQRLSLLVDKVLRLSMFEKQQVQLKMESFDLKQLTEEVISSMRLQFEKTKATVQLLADDDDLSVEADKLHITSVIFNLLDNALKYSKEKPAIAVLINRNTDGVTLTVSDNGIGIPAAYRKKVFDKFFRVPSGDTHNVKGYGLGLSYVANIVERHKGKIEVQSEPGQGSSFIIQLPDTI